MAGRLMGKVAIVTGAGSGIGRAVATRYGAEGALVLVNDIDAAGAATTVEAIVASGGTASVRTADVTRSNEVDDLVATAMDRYGALDIMHNNAGAQFVHDRLSEMSDEAWHRTFALNVDSVFFGIRAAIAVMAPAGRGSIISTSSLAGLGAVARSGAYGAAKAAVVHLTKVAAVEFAHTGVRVNAIAPGTMQTTGMEEWMRERGADLSEWTRQIPQGRLGVPDDIAAASMFLATDDSIYLNGVTIPVDGGRVAKLGGPHIE
jgi:NAD(P)-dependent dehydrogenase (short-subunit alcohol dehydrogenase family)